MVLATHQLQGSYVVFPSRPLSWRKGLTLRRHVVTLHMLGRRERVILLRRSVCLSIGAPHTCGLKAKNIRISAFKGTARNDESGGRVNDASVPKNAIKVSYVLKDGEETIIESSKAHNGSLAYASETSENRVGSPAIKKLFKKWVMILRSQSPSQVMDEALEERPLPRDTSETQIGTQSNRKSKIVKMVWGQFWDMDAIIKMPLLILCASGSAPFSYVASSLSSPFHSRLSLLRRPYNEQRERIEQLRNSKVLKLKGFLRRQNVLFATFKDQTQYIEIKPDDSELLTDHPGPEDISPVALSSIDFEGSDGRPGFISFYNRPCKRDNEVISNVQRNQSSLLWFIGPAVLVASFILPSLYLRRILSSILEDSLLTDFLILFFAEALFYCGVAIFLLLIDHLRRPIGLDSTAETLAPHFGQRISSVATLVLSLIIPMVTMGLVWPWTGPAASATLAPYLVGIVVQFAFEQYARHLKSPSWPVIPIIFQVYRLHQLNRAAQLVTALSFTVRGAEMTTHNLAINSSLGTLLNVLQCLGVICIWSLSSFLTRFLQDLGTQVLHAGESTRSQQFYADMYTVAIART
ncbi:hypothetical protein CRYUN_Cryun07bG0065000 [Craigia yunnanensis]